MRVGVQVLNGNGWTTMHHTRFDGPQCRKTLRGTVLFENILQYNRKCRTFHILVYRLGQTSYRHLYHRDTPSPDHVPMNNGFQCSSGFQ